MTDPTIQLYSDVIYYCALFFGFCILILLMILQSIGKKHGIVDWIGILCFDLIFLWGPIYKMIQSSSETVNHNDDDIYRVLMQSIRNAHDMTNGFNLGQYIIMLIPIGLVLPIYFRKKWFLLLSLNPVSLYVAYFILNNLKQDQSVANNFVFSKINIYFHILLVFKVVQWLIFGITRKLY